ncbi:MAG: flagellar hook-basal body protein [Planctomycetaceae bacterium]
MINGIYSAATAMQRATERHELIAQNLAQVNMPGYRRLTMRQQTFEASLSQADQQLLRHNSLGTSVAQQTNDFTQGPMERTDSPLDFALNGDGFFVVEAQGQQLYTRNGTFQIDAAGQLVTADGVPVMGENGPLTMPPDFTPSMLQVGADGTASVNGVQIGKLKVVSFPDPHVLSQRGVTLFAAPSGVAPSVSTATVSQGTRERSNVQPVTELVDMISAVRTQEAAQRAMSTISQAIQNYTRQ